MEKITVTVFGAYAPPCGDCDIAPADEGCSSCSTIDIMRKEAEHLKRLLKEKYGEAVACSYVDVESEEIGNYPDIGGILGNFQLPLTVLNGRPLLHGGMSLKKVSEAIERQLRLQ